MAPLGTWATVAVGDPHASRRRPWTV